MFSKKGFENYFEQLRKVEEDMAQAIYETLPQVKDKHVASILSAVLADEERHITLVERARQLFKL